MANQSPEKHCARTTSERQPTIQSHSKPRYPHLSDVRIRNGDSVFRHFLIKSPNPLELVSSLFYAAAQCATAGQQRGEMACANPAQCTVLPVLTQAFGLTVEYVSIALAAGDHGGVGTHRESISSEVRHVEELRQARFCRCSRVRLVHQRVEVDGPGEQSPSVDATRRGASGERCAPHGERRNRSSNG